MFRGGRRRLAALAVAALAALAGAAAADAAPRAVLWERWLAHDPASTLTVDHGAWAAFLARYLKKSPDGVNRLAYAEVDAQGRRLLAAYIARLAATPVSRLRRAEQLAYWINLYNALTVQVVLANYPVDSILEINISPGWFSIGPWGKKLVRVEGEEMSLDDIEHRVLRPIWRDPRIHYAVNCASFGCPNLAPLPYTAATADAMLTRAARAYVNHPRGVRVEGGRLFVSNIYHWYKEDFGGSDAGVIAHLKRYARPALAAALEGVEEIADHGYGWTLNDVRLGPGGAN